MRHLAGPIEREETDDGVVYRNLKILTRGVWTDQSSKQPTEYVPKNLEVEGGATVNVMHDESDVSAAGEIVAGSDQVEDGALYADVRFDTSTAAGEYADEALEAALESNGREGFGGPSVEIPPDGLVLEPDGPNGVPQTVEGTINGLGFVSQPAAKDTAFSQQTRERQVALSGQTDKGVLLQQRYMADAETARDILDSNGVDTGDLTDEEIMAIYEEMVASAEEGEEMQEGEEGEDDPEEEPPEDDPEEEEGEETEMQEGAIESIEEQIDDLWGKIDELEEMMATGEEMSAVKEELAAADTVEQIEKRLSDLEDEPKDPKTLADNDDEDIDWSDAESGTGYNSASRTTF